MNVFVDASAIVSMIVGEEDATELASALDRYAERTTSAIGFWEAVAALCRSYSYTPLSAQKSVRDFVDKRVIRINPVSYAETVEAIGAYDRYGKGRHRASLNMGDCFAYASAKTAEADLLYKGDDFSHTDLA